MTVKINVYVRTIPLVILLMVNADALEVGLDSIVSTNAPMADMDRIVWKNVDVKMVFVIMYLASVIANQAGRGHCMYCHVVAFAIPSCRCLYRHPLFVCFCGSRKSNCGELFIELEQQVSF